MTETVAIYVAGYRAVHMMWDWREDKTLCGSEVGDTWQLGDETVCGIGSTCRKCREAFDKAREENA
jgi:hypothetical protein